MDKIHWLINNFGFSLRLIGDMLDISASQVHKTLLGKRNLGALAKETLAHPLFNPYSIQIDEKDLTWADPDPEWRIKEMSMRRTMLENSLLLLEKKLNDIKSRHLHLHKLLLHTNQLPFTPEGGESILLKWWILQRAKANYAMQAFTKRKLEQMLIEKARMNVELLLINGWLGREE